MGNRSSLLIYISVSVAVTLWGLSFIWTNFLLVNNIPVFTLIFLRLALAGIILLIISLSLRKLQRISGGDWPAFLLLVLMEPFLYFIGETFGLQIVNSATIGAVIISTIPIFATIAGILFYKEYISTLNIFGVFLTIPGVLLVVFEKGNLDFSHYMGILVLFLAVFSAVAYSVIVKKLAGKYNSYTIVTYQHSLGALFFLPLFLIFNYKTFSISDITLRIFVPLFGLALLCSSLAFILFINSVRFLGVAKSSIFTALVPAVSASAAYLLGSEDMSFRKMAGVIIVIAGVIIAQRKKRVSSS
ncbi:MAG: DMT family transporter [Bacteroidales bacterium]|nr:DMT family transporter [Bacteroidales bacterium]MDD2425331.1 DMT family transporter [Bacteroidales bacterium]MDD3989393.1 DMT family transporter [Bacteroidales bacterium]MDD4639066.1 DMT family transporter [Bacteroidales bacterium]